MSIKEYKRFERKRNDLLLTKDNILEYYNSRYKKLREEKEERIEFQILEHEEGEKIILIDMEIENLINQYYQKLAIQMFYDVPPEYWVKSEFYEHRKVLSTKALSELRSKVLSENKVQLEQVIQLITVTTGLAGVAVAIISLST